VQVGKDGSGYVIIKRGSKNVHMVTWDNRDGLSILSCINAKGEHLPNFYIFKGKKRSRNVFKKFEKRGCDGYVA